MNYEKHSNLEGKHALIGASKHSWVNKNPEQILDMCARQYVTSIGTALHDIARKHVKHGFKLTKSSKKEVLLSVIEDYKIPGNAIDRAIDYDVVFDNLMNYVNDAIGYRMVPEQILYYSDNCFGTADAISSLDSIVKNRMLRIHDLKTGTTPVHIEQLEIYAALFCLEYHMKPGDMDMELCIYQSGDIIVHNPTAEDILPIMDKIVSVDKIITAIKEA